VKRRVIVNADDFGFSASANRGIIAAHQSGIVSSTSLMVNMPAAAEAADLAKQNARLGVGLHLNFTCGRPVSSRREVPSLVDQRGEFLPIGAFLRRIHLRRIDSEHLEREITAQFRRFQELGLNCTHFDGHRHIQGVPRLLRMVMPIAKAFGVQKCRLSHETRRHERRTAGEWLSTAHWSQDFKATLLRHWARQCRGEASRAGFRFPESFQGIVAMSKRADNPFLDMLNRCTAATNEIMCHPAQSTGEAEFMEGYHSGWRQRELALLSSEITRTALSANNLELISFASL
jgi:predicted glycoside hydrolase/deacetylase ChbG (UPF0249 family)